MVSSWSFLSNYGRVMVEVARRPDARLRDIADAVGITPRAAQTIITELVTAGFLERERVGRRNHYHVRSDRALPDSAAADHAVGDLLGALVSPRTVGRDPGRDAGPQEGRTSLVLACSDHRYQEALRMFLVSQDLTAHTEVLLWPGGAGALTGSEGQLLLGVMASAAHREPPQRVVLIAHEDCHSRAGFERWDGDVMAHLRAVKGRRSRTIDLVTSATGVPPETWFLTSAGARCVGRREPLQTWMEGSGAVPSGDLWDVRAAKLVMPVHAAEIRR